ncbi:MAG: flagellar regulator YcgR PilZN domain-containing protein [Gallionella sp.]
MSDIDVTELRPTSPKYSKTKKPLANAVYRSRIEIGRILNELASSETVLFAELEFDRLFTTTILHVDNHAGYLVIGYGESKKLNIVLFDYPVMQCRVSYLGAHLFFRLSSPTEYLLEDKYAVRYALPDSLLWSQRREQQRITVPPSFPLHCVYKHKSGQFFKASVFDISLDGMGGMVFEENLTLQIGTVLEGCRITCPGFEPLVVDLVVRNVMSIAHSDGTIQKRAGVRFLQRPEEIQILINTFIYDLGNI